MKKLAFFLISIAFLLVVVDVLFGYAADIYVDKYGLRGDYRPIGYVMNETEDDILLLGSSVVINSIMPSVIEDSLEYTCYNAGANAQTLVYYHTMLNCVLQRYTPKAIVLGLTPGEFAYDGLGRYNVLIPYYNQGYAEIDSVLESKDRYNSILLKSNLYRYNTIWFRILLYHILNYNEGNLVKGFMPHNVPFFPPTMRHFKADNSCITDRNLKLFTDIISVCRERGVELVVCFTPLYDRYEDVPYVVKEIREICVYNNIHCYYDTQDSLFLEHADWFYDNLHLNKYGALEYSKMFASRLKSILK